MKGLICFGIRATFYTLLAQIVWPCSKTCTIYEDLEVHSVHYGKEFFNQNVEIGATKIGDSHAEYPTGVSLHVTPV